MTLPGYHTRTEILSQPQSWTAALEVIDTQRDSIRQFFRAGGYESLLFTGCGSTYYLSLALAAVAQELLGLPAQGLPASEVWLYSHSAYSASRKTLLVAVSRSGETTETLRACEAFRSRGGEVLTLSCYPHRPLTDLGHLNLVLPSGQEQSVAQTRAFSTLYLAGIALITLWSGRADLFQTISQLPAICQTIITDTLSSLPMPADPLAFDRIYFLGSGMRYGLACELSLKMKEMSLSHSEPFHFMEFRHGPKSMITPGTLVVALVGETNRSHELAVLDDLRGLGAQIWTIGEGQLDMVFDSGVPEVLRGALYLPAGQLLAFERALHKELDPDWPAHLDAVVKLV